MSTLFKIIHLVLVISFSMTACKKMDDNYKEYTVPDGITYPGKAKHAALHPGRERALITWPAGADPSIVKAHVYWNNYTDSVVIDIPERTDTVRCFLDPLPEGSYSFIIHTFDAKGNISIPVELNGFVYGDLYASSISQRLINAFSIDLKTGKYAISWDDADLTNGAWLSEVKYTDIHGDEKIAASNAMESTTLISEMDMNEPFYYRTMYMPDSLSIDKFYTDFLTYTIDEFEVPKDDMMILDVSSSHPGDDNSVWNIIDGKFDTNTRWHTSAIAGDAPKNNYPHYVEIDFGGIAPVTRIGFRSSLKDRPANSPDPRHPKQFKILTRLDKNEEWTLLTTYDFVQQMDQYATFPSTNIRYIRFEAEEPSSYNGTAFLVLGELYFYCK